MAETRGETYFCRTGINRAETYGRNRKGRNLPTLFRGLFCSKQCVLEIGALIKVFVIQ